MATRKRKSPAPLIAVLVLLLGGIGFANMQFTGSGGDGHNHDHGAPESDQPSIDLSTPKPTAPDDKDKTSEMLKDGLGKATATAAKPGDKGKAAEPKVEPKPEGMSRRMPAPAPKGMVVNPQKGPSETATAGQWYSDESYAKDKMKSGGR